MRLRASASEDVRMSRLTTSRCAFRNRPVARPISSAIFSSSSSGTIPRMSYALKILWRGSSSMRWILPWSALSRDSHSAHL